MSKIYDKVKLFVDRIFGSTVTHTMITKTGRKIKCIDSLELFGNENKIYVGKCQSGLKYNIVTINSDNVEYIVEKFNKDTWLMILGINPPNTEIDEENIDRFYG